MQAEASVRYLVKHDLRQDDQHSSTRVKLIFKDVLRLLAHPQAERKCHGVYYASSANSVVVKCSVTRAIPPNDLAPKD